MHVGCKVRRCVCAARAEAVTVQAAAKVFRALLFTLHLESPPKADGYGGQLELRKKEKKVDAFACTGTAVSPPPQTVFLPRSLFTFSEAGIGPDRVKVRIVSSSVPARQELRSRCSKVRLTPPCNTWTYPHFLHGMTSTPRDGMRVGGWCTEENRQV